MGLPVVPLVKCSSDIVSGSVAPIVKSGEATSTTSAQRVTPGSSPGASPTTITCSSPGSRSRRPLTLRWYSSGVVTSTRASPISQRVAIGSGPKAENSGLTTQRAFSAPSTARYSSGSRPINTNTRSPGCTPSAPSALAKRLVPAARSA